MQISKSVVSLLSTLGIGIALLTLGNFVQTRVQAQTLTLTSPATTTVAPGQVVNLVLTLIGSAGANIADLEWGLNLPAGVTAGAVIGGTASTAAQKTIYCNVTNTLCVGLGLSQASPPSPPVLSNLTYSDGVVASVPVTIPSGAAPGPMVIGLISLAGASLTGGLVTVTSGAGAGLTLTVLNKCDVNKDGVVNSVDVSAVLNPLLGVGVCPLPAGCTLQQLIAVQVAANGGGCLLP